MRIVPLLAATCLVASACVRTSTDPVTGRVDLDVESPTKQGEDWDANITSTTNPGIQGSAEARVISGQSSFTIIVTGLTAGSNYTWHVHEGGCGAAGPVVGSASAYGALRVGTDGRATSSAKVDMQLDEARTYSIDVHSSGWDANTVLACGNLSD